MARLAFFATIALLLLASCKQSAPRTGVNLQPVRVPEWTRTGIHPDFPEDRFIVTYGVARGRADAIAEAESRLEAEICGWPLYEHRALFANTDFAEVVTQTPAWLPLERLGDAVRHDLAATGFEHYAVRAISFDELRLRSRALLPELRAELTSTDTPPGGVGNLNRRIEMWGDYLLKAGRVVMVGLIAEQQLDRNAFEKLEESARQLWELTSLMRVHQGGNGGRCRFHGGVDEPLEIVARFRNQSAAGVPLRWAPAAGFRGSVTGDDALDSNGRAQGRVLQLAPTGDEFGYIEARLDIDRVLGRRTGVAMPPWLWSVTLPARTNSEVIIDITETINREAPPELLLRPELEKWCKGRGLLVRDPETGFTGKPYKLRLRGSLEVRSWVENELPFAHATGRVELVDEDTGQVLFRFYPGLKKEGQRGNTEATMILTARQDAVADIISEFAARLIALLPAQGDEFGRGG